MLMPDPAAAANRLQSTALGERPQERLERHGAAALSDTELLAMLLRSGTRGHDVLSLSASLISEAGSLAGLIAWKEGDFKKLKGIGRVKALQLLTVMEVARRILRQQRGHEVVLESAEAVVAYMRPQSHGLDVEKFWVLCLNRRNRLLRLIEITSGIASSTLVHPREVFREAIREGASTLICVHNHPSGDPLPSAADLKATRQLRETGVLLDIPLADHVIMGVPAFDPAGIGYYSFREAGVI